MPSRRLCAIHELELTIVTTETVYTLIADLAGDQVYTDFQ